MAWSVQATWTVDDDERSYEPVIVRTKWGARRVATNMRRTLWHFPTLEIVIRKVDSAPDSQAIVSAEPSEVHLAESPDAVHTSCGASVEGLTALCYDVELFRMLGRPCSECLHATGS